MRQRRFTEAQVAHFVAKPTRGTARQAVSQVRPAGSNLLPLAPEMRWHNAVEGASGLPGAAAALAQEPPRPRATTEYMCPRSFRPVARLV